MQSVNELEHKPFDSILILSLALLVPPLFWWTALFLSLTLAKGIAEFLGNGIFQIVMLVVCPLAAAILSFLAAKQNGSKLKWTIAAVGILFAATAFPASFRNS